MDLTQVEQLTTRVCATFLALNQLDYFYEITLHQQQLGN